MVVCMIGGVLCSFTFTRVCGILFATARKWSILPLRSAKKMKEECVMFSNTLTSFFRQFLAYLKYFYEFCITKVLMTV